MIVTVTGTITSIDLRVKEGKESTELLLAQDKQKEQITIRLNGDLQEYFKQWTPQTFTGRLMAWGQRNGVGSMIMISDEDAAAIVLAGTQTAPTSSVNKKEQAATA
ncbi:hypothetical protein [Paenibacillus sinopodophylli]|uniref:hypothetical protein n=1 Tax=Paenibacillus sinopodophylli TaxID=1837342 RepID=UPI00110D1041|nr:hypothetical protein [Paenibacillus sinopodophylli]